MTSTTSLFVELLIAGLQSLGWLALLASILFDRTSLNVATAKDWMALVTAMLFALAYSFGIGIDRIADKLFERPERQISQACHQSVPPMVHRCPAIDEFSWWRC